MGWSLSIHLNSEYEYIEEVPLPFDIWKETNLQSYFWSWLASHLCSFREFNSRSTVLTEPGLELCSPVLVVTDTQNNWWSIQTDFTCNSISSKKQKSIYLQPYPTTFYTALALPSVYFTDYSSTSRKKSSANKRKKKVSEKYTLNSINNATDISWKVSVVYLLAIVHAQHAIIPRTEGSLLLPSNHSLRIRFAFCMNC